MQLDEIDMGADMEWVSHFLDDSGPYDLDLATAIGNTNSKDDSPFRTSSPVSVLEPNSRGGGGRGSSSSSSSSSSSLTTTSTSSSSSSSFSSGFGGGSSSSNNATTGNPSAPISNPPEPMVIPGRARTKRSRPASFSSRTPVAIPIVPPSSEPAAPEPSDPESFGENEPPPMLAMKKKKKKKTTTNTPTLTAAADGEECGPPPVRKCMHCQITKTPQWRAGPMGPKTLCNACGVRYKSGRLFPEYRPAASPTFVPSIHSNSHKKVVEMRIKAGQKAAATGMALPDNPATKGCDLLQFIRRRE